MGSAHAMLCYAMLCIYDDERLSLPSYGILMSPAKSFTLASLVKVCIKLVHSYLILIHVVFLLVLSS